MTLAVIAALVSQWRQTVRSEVEAGGTEQSQAGAGPGGGTGAGGVA